MQGPAEPLGTLADTGEGPPVPHALWEMRAFHQVCARRAGREHLLAYRWGDVDQRRRSVAERQPEGPLPVASPPGASKADGKVSYLEGRGGKALGSLHTTGLLSMSSCHFMGRESYPRVLPLPYSVCRTGGISTQRGPYYALVAAPLVPVRHTLHYMCPYKIPVQYRGTVRLRWGKKTWPACGGVWHGSQ